MEPRSLYVHVPFCARRCAYCDFAVEATRTPPAGEWLEAVGVELQLTAEERGWRLPLDLDTLYVGGGTPSLLEAGTMSALLERLAPHARLAAGAEWTCEANPESFTSALAEDWRAAGVNRISLGAQTFHEPSLRWMGRLHGVEGPARAMAAARAAGFDNVGVDLIFGLPRRLGRDWAADLERAVALAPEHVSLYGLTAEAGAPLGRRVAEGREALADEDDYADEYLLAHRVLTDAGFEHYEVSNFGRPGCRSRHNFVYWAGEPYGALGPGAHAFHPPLRRWNLRSWTAYRDALRAGSLPIDGQETIDAEAMDLERIWLGLRTAGGYRFGSHVPLRRELAERWAARGLASLADGAVRLTPEGWLLLDQLAVEMQQAAGGAGPPARVPRARAIDAREPPVQIAANSNPRGA